MKHLKIEVSHKSSEKQIYDRYAEKMLLVCYRYIGNILDAEEVLHNAFLKIFDNKSKFKNLHENAFSAWIKRIMINESLMFLRSKLKFRIVSLDENTETPDDEEYTELPDAEHFFRIIGELPAGYRTVFNLFAVENFSHREISEMLQISESTSRSQLSKAVKILRNRVNEKILNYGNQ